MNKISIFLVTYLIIIVLPVHAIQNDPIKGNDIAILTIAQMPYGYSSNNDEPTGVFYDILNEIVTSSGINAKNVITPPKRIYNLINSNAKICILSADTPLIMARLDKIEPIDFIFQAGILPNTGIELSDYSSLKDITIAVPLGINVDEKFHNDNNLTKVFPSQYLNAIKMLKINRVDAVAGAISTLKFIAKLEGMKDKDLGKPLIFSQYNVNLFCSYNIPQDTKKKLKEAIINLKNKGIITNIINHYFNIDSN
jgi:polar amino acid transport system substrate-binding protein